MRIITKFTKFIYEDLDNSSTPSDISINSQKEQMNKNISDFNSKKSQLSSIYSQATSEVDLKNKLISANFISKENSNFINPILGKFSKGLQLGRNLDLLQKDMEKNQSDMKSLTDFISQNPSSREDSQDKMKSLNDQKSKISEKLSELKQMISKENKSMDQYLRDLSNNLKDV
jgi:chromosome segregation ATPase